VHDVAKAGFGQGTNEHYDKYVFPIRAQSIVSLSL